MFNEIVRKYSTANSRHGDAIDCEDCKKRFVDLDLFSVCWSNDRRSFVGKITWFVYILSVLLMS